MDFSNYTIISDLDGTIFSHGALIPQNAEPIKRFTAGGGHFTIATGRNHTTLIKNAPDLVELINAPALLCNGTYFYDFKKNERLGERCLTPEQAKLILSFSEKYFPNVPYRLSLFDGIRCQKIEGYVANDVAYYGVESSEVSPVSTWPLDDWYKVVFREEPEVLAEVRRVFEEKCSGNGISVFKTARLCLEMQNELSDKGKGVDWVRTQLPNGGGKVIACGDFENDIGMLKAADVAICPENASDEVKRICDHVLCPAKDGLINDILKLIEEGKI